MTLGDVTLKQLVEHIWPDVDPKIVVVFSLAVIIACSSPRLILVSTLSVILLGAAIIQVC